MLPIDDTHFRGMVRAFEFAIEYLTQDNVRDFYIQEKLFLTKQAEYTVGMENERRIMRKDLKSIIPPHWVE